METNGRLLEANNCTNTWTTTKQETHTPCSFWTAFLACAVCETHPNSLVRYDENDKMHDFIDECAIEIGAEQRKTKYTYDTTNIKSRTHDTNKHEKREATHPLLVECVGLRLIVVWPHDSTKTSALCACQPLDHRAVCGVVRECSCACACKLQVLACVLRCLFLTKLCRWPRHS